MYSLNYLVIIFKLIILLGVNATLSFSPHRGVINRARDSHQQLTQHNPAALSPLRSILATSTLSAASKNTFRLRRRHRKRHINWFDYNENTTMLELANPCGGEYHPHAKQARKPTKKEQRRIYNKLRQTALYDLRYLNGSDQQVIDISNMKIWCLYNNTYKFLPKLKPNSSIALKRWYRKVQIYMASFGYLYNIQLKYDQSKSQRESLTSLELKELLWRSRNMLCDLQTAVNKTYPRKNRQIPQITFLEINNRLKLRTKDRFKDDPNVLAETDSIDLKFVKFHYLNYLKSMWQLLIEFNKRHSTRYPKQQQQTNKYPQITPGRKSLDDNQTKRNRRRKSRIHDKLV